MALFYGGQGVGPSLKGAPTNVYELQAGQVMLLQPAGWYEVKPGKFTAIQMLDPITGIWRTIGAGATGASLERIYSDGVNFRLANQSGCVVGAEVTTGNAGTGYTSPPTIVPSAGSAIFKAIVGGALNTAVTVTNGGTNYTYPPIVEIAAPPPGGIQATGYCTLSAGAVSTVTLIDQGAGYASPPQITFVADPREGLNGVTQGSGAAAVSTLTGAGTITGIVVIDHGKPVTGTTVPTLVFSGGGGSGAAALSIMCWSITAYVVSATTAGSGYVAPVLLSAYSSFPGTAAAYANPTTQDNLVKGRNALILAALSTGALTATGQKVFDGGVYPDLPTVYVQSANVPGAGAVAGVFLTPTMGGQNDISFVGPV